MLKRFFCVCLISLMPGLNMLSAMALDDTPLVVEPYKATILHADREITLTFMNDFDVNKACEGDVVKFKLDEDFSDIDGDILPKNTVFYAKVENLQKAKFGLRKASAQINFKKMVLPNGEIYKIDAKAENKLTSDAKANAGKGIATAAAATGIGMLGAAVIAVECLSVGGIIFVPYTGAAFGVGVAAASKGVNYKAPKGTKIKVKFDHPIDAI